MESDRWIILKPLRLMDIAGKIYPTYGFLIALSALIFL